MKAILKSWVLLEKEERSSCWLERAGFLQRNHNLTEVFQGKPLVAGNAAKAELPSRIARSASCGSVSRLPPRY